jgi:ATP-dependent helicase/nuclease subunit B
VTGGLRVVFDPDFDFGYWPGPLAEREASAGEVWVGETGLLGVLETLLGLGGRRISSRTRAAALVPALKAMEGFWSRSAEVDPIGSAKKLLDWRDQLRLAGWDGLEVQGYERLSALSRVTASCQPGVPDRLEGIRDVLLRHRVDLEAIESFERIGEGLLAWRKLFEALERVGVRCALKELEAAPASGDLKLARTSPFVPKADGSLQLLRPEGPLQAADEVAAWLAALPSLESTVVIGADPVLDWALRRHGLPTVGCSGKVDDNVLLQVLPLALACLWSPPDPQRVLELLMLPVGPLRKDVAIRLARALQEWPAVGSDDWVRALDEALSKLETDEERSKVKEVLDSLLPLEGTAHGEPIPVDRIRARAGFVQNWISRHVAAMADAVTDEWLQATRQVSTFREILEASGLQSFSASQLGQLLAETLGEVSGPVVFPVQAGLTLVGQPGGIIGSVHNVIWWAFRRESVPAFRSLPLGRVERTELAALGVELPDPAARAARATKRWRRPLEQSSTRMLLVSPRREDNGDPSFPHPLWEELRAAMPTEADEVRLVKTQVQLPAGVRTTRPLRSVVSPRRDWTTAGTTIGLRPLESPSSLEALVRCSLKWALKYPGRIQPGLSASVSDGDRLLGSVVHKILERTLQDGSLEPEAAASRALEIFDRDLPRMAAALYLPGSAGELRKARLVTERAARFLAVRLKEGHYKVAAVEKLRRRSSFGIEFEGRPDLLLDPTTVIDFKWSGRTYRIDELRAGTALQLASYAFLASSPGNDMNLPPVGYFILKRQEMLALNSGSIRGATTQSGPAIEKTWAAFEAGVSERRKELEEGLLEAGANPDADGLSSPEKDSLEDGAFFLDAGCKFCDFDALCGNSFPAARK